MKFYGIFPVLPGCGSGCRFLFWMMIHDKLYPKIRRFSRIEHRLCVNFWFWKNRSPIIVVKLRFFQTRGFLLSGHSFEISFLGAERKKTAFDSIATRTGCFVAAASLPEQPIQSGVNPADAGTSICVQNYS